MRKDDTEMSVVAVSLVSASRVEQDGVEAGGCCGCPSGRGGLELRL